MKERAFLTFVAALAALALSYAVAALVTSLLTGVAWHLRWK